MPREPDDAADVRVSDAERQSVVDRLSRAVGDGLVTLDEFADHAGSAYAARTRAELDEVTRALRLPVVASQPAPARLAETPPTAAGGAATATRRRWIVAIMGGEERKGRWRVNRRMGAFALMGGVELDLRDALLEDDEVEITAWAIMGGVTVIVPEGIAVESEGFILMGGRTNRVKGTPLPGAPVVRIRGYGMWGGVEVKSRRPREDDDGDHVGRSHHRIVMPPLPLPPIPSPPPMPQFPHTRHRDRDRDRDRERDRFERRHGEPLRAERTVAAAPTGVVTIVCTDIVGSTRLADTLGDQRWRDLLGAHNTVVREHLARYGGTEVKTSGDGFLVAFSSARSAVCFALDVRDAVGRLDLELRVGLHAGEVERDGNDIVGRNVSLTFRLCDAAAPGEVLASAMVADLADSSSDIAFGDQRELALAGIERPVNARPASRRP